MKTSDPVYKFLGLPTITIVCLMFATWLYGMEKIDGEATNFFSRSLKYMAAHPGFTGWSVVGLSLLGLRLWYKRNVW